MRDAAPPHNPRTSAAKIAAMRTLPNAARAAVLALLFAAFASSAFAQDVDHVIRMRVEELQATGAVAVHGEPLAGRRLLPEIYENREFTPTWRTLAQIDSLLVMLDESYLEGLDPADYHAAALRRVRASITELDALPAKERAELDLLLTDSVVRLGYHLRFGKVDATKLDPNWTSTRELLDEDPAITIQAAIDAPSLREFAARVIPRVFLYDRFKAALAQYRVLEANGGWPTVPAGPTLKAGMDDPRVSVLAARLAVTGDLAAPDAANAVAGTAVDSAGTATLYDETLAEAVQRFQQRHGLAADGVVGAATLAALNVPVESRIAQLRANLERARWVFYDPSSEFLVVNIAGFQLYLIRRGEVVWRTRVQVGRPYRQTPIFRAEMKYLVVNPTWTVPPTIFRNDIVPEQRRNPGYLASRNIDLFDQAGAAVDPAAVDWSARSLPYRLVQRPGPDNALGRIKFMFPNEHAVYLHETPSRDLFSRDNRAFSSGCIRVEYPLELAEQLLGGPRARERLDALIASGRTETVFLEKPMPVMLLYWTAEVDAAGRVSFFPDVYERDAAVSAALARPFEVPPTL
jgi:murein L,D-transpeptidase YcbB/YkuD